MKATIIISCIVFMAEIGCILRSACFVEQYGKFPVLLGTVIGTALTATIGIFLGDAIGKALPHEITHLIAGLMLIIVGALMIFNNHTCGSH